MKEELFKNGVNAYITINGSIFCKPDYNIIKLYPRYFDTFKIAYNHYKPYFKTN